MRLPALGATDVERVLSKIGFQLDRQKGSHRIWLRPADGAMVVVPAHRRDLKRGLLFGIIRSTGLTVDEFIALL